MRFPTYYDLTPEQDRINELPLEESHVVVGPPGTGKTVMALYRASALHEAGFEVKLLMHGRLLSQYTRGAAAVLQIEDVVSTFHSWFYRWYRDVTGERVPEIERWKVDWPSAQESLTRAGVERGAIDCLVVDEGQDFAPGFHVVASYIARNVMVFADENQRITEQHSTVEEIRRAVGVPSLERLTRNHRNTREIAEFAARFYVGLASGVPELPDRRGDPPVLFADPDLATTLRRIVRWERNNPDQTIGVFVHTLEQQQRMLRGLRGKTRHVAQHYNHKTRDALVDFERPGVIVVTYSSAKGLEFDAVFIPELQDAPLDAGALDARMRMYVLASRARDHLFLAYSGQGEPAIVRELGLDVLERR